MWGGFRDPLPPHAGGCGELGRAAVAPTSLVVQAAEMLLVLLGSAGAAVGRMGAMRNVGQQWRAILQLGEPEPCHACASPAPLQGRSTSRPTCVHLLPAPAPMHGHCRVWVSAQGQHIEDMALLFTPSHHSPKYPPGTPCLHQPQARSLLLPQH